MLTGQTPHYLPLKRRHKLLYHELQWMDYRFKIRQRLLAELKGIFVFSTLVIFLLL